MTKTHSSRRPPRRPKESLRAEPAEPIHEKALKLLSVRARGRVELARRLAQAGFAGEEVTTELDRLERSGLVDDERFARERCQLLCRQRGYGPHKIRADLLHRGIPRALVEQTLSEVIESGEDPRAQMSRLLERHFGPRAGEIPSDPRLRARACRYLLSRGFDADGVYALLSEASEDA
jgi:regulatory protein